MMAPATISNRIILWHAAGMVVIAGAQSKTLSLVLRSGVQFLDWYWSPVFSAACRDGGLKKLRHLLSRNLKGCLYADNLFLIILTTRWVTDAMMLLQSLGCCYWNLICYFISKGISLITTPLLACVLIESGIHERCINNRWQRYCC